MKNILVAIFALYALCHQVSAKAYFQTMEEMIQRAEVIAIITITDVQDADAKGKTWTYRKAGKASVETVLKGTIPKTFTLSGAEAYLCASCPIAEGRMLAFLKKDDDLWTGSNWHISLRPIKDGLVEWYVAGDNRYEMKPTALDAVLAEIKTQTASKAVDSTH